MSRSGRRERGAPALLVVDARDNVATAARALEAGETARIGAAPGAGTAGAASLTLREVIPLYHKTALRDIPAGQAVIKYGESIGIALRDIRAGEHVHVHNLAGRRAGGRGAGDRGATGGAP